MNIAFAGGILLPQKFLGVDYFVGFREHFENSDVRAFFPDVRVTASISNRADDLGAALTSPEAKAKFDPNAKIHIIAHSMGGLDARLLISRNQELRGQIASLTTLCTPHHGSLAADFLTGHEPPLFDPRRIIFDLIKNAFSAAHIDISGFEELTTDFAKRFANDALPVPGFKYFSVAGVGHATPPLTTPLLLLTHDHIENATHEPNDGLVHLSSATFGELLDKWPADHFEAVGFSIDPFRKQPPFHPLPRVDAIVQKLRTL